ncbi:MAG TPA: hypothetical protein DCZ03_13825 [Gammaproteobacteria bacterium]|nr:hypothetical protein [Gammaproteobacteria bacterium]
MTRSYELTTDLRMMMHSEKPLLKVPKAVGGYFEYQFLPHYFGGTPKWRQTWRFLTRKSRVLPDFALTGPIKSCSSAITLSINSHRCVMPPLAKEFTLCGANTELWRIYYPTQKEVKAHADREGMALCGFFEPFMNWYRLIHNYHEKRPDAKIILLLRDPVTRAYSHWKWDILLGGPLIRNLPYYESFDEYVKLALDLFPQSPMDGVCGVPMLQTGIYTKAVQIWMDTFGPDQVIVLTSEDYINSPKDTLEKIQNFLGLPTEPLPESRLNENPLQLPRPKPETLEKLSEFYRPYNESLFSLIGQRFDWS